jgi:hypothetical protein
MPELHVSKKSIAELFGEMKYRKFIVPEFQRPCKWDTDRKIFTEEWNDLTQLCKQANISIDDIFRYYMHIIRARNSDSTKEVGLRKFYAYDHYKYLKYQELIDELLILANFLGKY